MEENAVSKFRWLDLAASDIDSAIAFYCGLFGWTAREYRANGGVLTRLYHDGDAVGSMYRLGARERIAGVPSHWTPYVRVESLDDALEKVEALGARVLVPAFDVEGMARVSLIEDTVGATIGLWQESGFPAPTDSHGSWE